MVNIQIDAARFRTGLTRMQNAMFPEAVAKALGAICKTARRAVVGRTKSVFKLHTHYIPNSVIATPRGPAQRRAVAGKLSRQGYAYGSVYLRPGAGRRDNSFMMPHETGKPKDSRDGSLAVPSSDLSHYKTSTGAVKKTKKPATLLAYFNSNNFSRHIRKRGRKPQGKAFILKGVNGSDAVIARRKTGGNRKALEFLYHFKQQVKIRPVWRFEETVISSVLINYSRYFRRFIGRL